MRGVKLHSNRSFNCWPRVVIDKFEILKLEIEQILHIGVHLHGRELAGRAGLTVPEEELHKRAEQFALSRAGRSPRVAKQFIDYLSSVEK